MGHASRVLIFTGICSVFQPTLSWAWSRAKPNYRAVSQRMDGKKVIQLAPVQDVKIEMPGRAEYHFGEDYQISLTTQLTQSGRYIVMDSGLNSNPETAGETSGQPSTDGSVEAQTVASSSGPINLSDASSQKSNTESGHMAPECKSPGTESSQLATADLSSDIISGINPSDRAPASSETHPPNQPPKTKVCRKKI